MRVVLLLACLPLAVAGQQTVSGTLVHGGLTRSYLLYLPASYTGLAPVPLVLNFHGYTNTAAYQMGYGDFRPVADTAGFLVACPQGTTDILGNYHWNVGWGGSTVDDVGFAEALIDSLEAQYNIDDDRVYSTGWSNGGFLCYKLACELSGRIAAMASVSGTMNAGQPAGCSPLHPMPAMEIHGTADSVILYNGNSTIEAVPVTMRYWVDFNHADTIPVVTLVPDIDPTDGSTVEHQVFPNGDDGVEVEHFKVVGGGHSWPGTSGGGAGVNKDIDASAEIWRFFSRYDIHGLIVPAGIASPPSPPALAAFPNPAGSSLVLRTSVTGALPYRVCTPEGRIVLAGTATNGEAVVDLRGLPGGLYFLSAGAGVLRIVVTR